MKYKIQQRHWSRWEVRSNWREVCITSCHRSGSQTEEPCGPSHFHLIPGESQRNQMCGLLSVSTQPGQLVPEKPGYVVDLFSDSWSDNGLKSSTLCCMKIYWTISYNVKSSARLVLAHLMSCSFFTDCHLVGWVTFQFWSTPAPLLPQRLDMCFSLLKLSSLSLSHLWSLKRSLT